MASDVLSRDDCGLRLPRWVTANSSQTGITAHYMGTNVWPDHDGTEDGLLGVADHARCPTIWAAIQAGHMADPNAADIYYSAGVCPHGWRLMGRGPGVQQGANGSAVGNRIRLTVCYLGGDRDPITAAAKFAYHDWAADWGLGLADVHNAWFNTSCAGPYINPWGAEGFPLPQEDDGLSAEDVAQINAHTDAVAADQTQKLWRRQLWHDARDGSLWIVYRQTRKYLPTDAHVRAALAAGVWVPPEPSKPPEWFDNLHVLGEGPGHPGIQTLAWKLDELTENVGAWMALYGDTVTPEPV